MNLFRLISDIPKYFSQLDVDLLILMIDDNKILIHSKQYILHKWLSSGGFHTIASSNNSVIRRANAIAFLQNNFDNHMTTSSFESIMTVPIEEINNKKRKLHSFISNIDHNDELKTEEDGFEFDVKLLGDINDEWIENIAVIESSSISKSTIETSVSEAKKVEAIKLDQLVNEFNVLIESCKSTSKTIKNIKNPSISSMSEAIIDHIFQANRLLFSKVSSVSCIESSIVGLLQKVFQTLEIHQLSEELITSIINNLSRHKDQKYYDETVVLLIYFCLLPKSRNLTTSASRIFLKCIETIFLQAPEITMRFFISSLLFDSSHTGSLWKPSSIQYDLIQRIARQVYNLLTPSFSSDLWFNCV